MGKNLKGEDIGKNLSQRPDGRYMARAQVNGEFIILYGSNLGKLRLELRKAVMEKKLADSQIPEKRWSLNQWFAEWYEKYKAPSLKHGGSQSYVRLYVNYFGRIIGNKPVCEIKPKDVQGAVAQLLKEGRTPKTVKESTSILKHCLEAAQANGLTSINATIGILIPASDPVERRVLTIEEQEAFLAYVKLNNRWFRELYELALLTGMRIGELGGLQWQDIDFEEGFIYVRRALLYDYGEGDGKRVKLTTPKTLNSVRKIPFFKETKLVLFRQRKKVEVQRLKSGIRWKQPEELGDLVFLTHLGSPVGRYAVENDLRWTVEQINYIALNEAMIAGKPPVHMDRIYPHALRHTFATRCFEKGMTPRTVQEIMGHSNYKTTVSYTHVLDNVKKEESEKIGSFFARQPKDKKRSGPASDLYRYVMGIM